jgi:tetratricopeptide (TPR) repeat protein
VLTDIVPKGEAKLEVVPERLHVVVAEDGSRALTLVLPPLDDLAEIDALKSQLVSLDESSDLLLEERRERLAAVLKSHKHKLERFSDSPILLNRLAILAAASGDREQESYFLELARDSADDDFFAHRYADNLVATKKYKEAREIFESMDLRVDAQANLKLAAFHLRDDDFNLAEDYVRQALEIDPLNFNVRLFDGGLALAKAQYDRAIHSFRIAATERPTSSAVQTNMAIAYFQLGLRDKALSALKRAVALDPLNPHAIILLADVAHRYRVYEEAIPSLRFFVQFEQKDAGIWARLARGLLELGKYDEAVAALKRQASLHETSAIWNNLGVAYCRSDQVQKALRAFKHAMERAGGERGRDYFLSARNLVQLCTDRMSSEDVLALTRSLIDQDQQRMLLACEWLCDIYSFHMFALRRTGRNSEMVQLGRELLEQPDLAESLRYWVTAHLVSHFALYDHDKDTVLEFISDRRSWLENANPRDEWRKGLLFNNIAFALAEFDLVGEADAFLRRIQQKIHVDAYPTATLGLIQLRKGHLERAVELYEEAIHIASSRVEKIRIRQKLNLELGRYWVSSHPSRARRLLEKVAAEDEGEIGLVRQARRELSVLPRA